MSMLTSLQSMSVPIAVEVCLQFQEYFQWFGLASDHRQVSPAEQAYSVSSDREVATLIAV